MSYLFNGASWLSSSIVGSFYYGVPAPCFRREFSIPREISSAVLHITALGLYECEINGIPVGDHALAPGWTDYRLRVAVQSYEVKSHLQLGKNALGVLLGDGWYCGSVAWKPRQIYGDRPKFITALVISYEDGTIETICSDSQWNTAPSATLQNDLLKGETHDARMEAKGWSCSGFDDSQWKAAQRTAMPEIVMEPSPAPPIRRIEILPPVSVVAKEGWPTPIRIYDFGQNFSGRARISIRGQNAQNIRLRYAEVTDKDGCLYTDNLRGATAVDYYTCSGEGTETWEPRFTFHGFRYVEVTGIKDEDSFTIEGVVLHSDMPLTGEFSCSNPLLNQLQSNIIWGQKSNFIDVPTDCPQRDERLGWTGDAQVFIRTACFNMDTRGFFHKWMQDVRDVQSPTGAVPPVAPNFDFVGTIEDGGPAWSDAIIICPWTIYLCYADKSILQNHYESMQRYMNFLATYRCRDYIRSPRDLDEWGGFGDWLALDGSGKVVGATPKDLIGTAFYAYDAEIMAKVAAILDDPQQAEFYTQLHTQIVAAFQKRFVSADGLLISGTQTAHALALHFGLVPTHNRSQVAAALADDIKGRNYHLSTGFVGTPYLLDALSDNGYSEIAYKLLEQEAFPSWLFPVKNGATTIWERWDGWTAEKGFQDKGMNSFNHYAYGAVGAWMYRVMAGLDLDPDQPGYQHIIFRPRPGGSITWAAAQLASASGEVSIRWEIRDGQFSCCVNVPDGSTATFYPPYGNESLVRLGSGEYRHCTPLD